MTTHKCPRFFRIALLFCLGISCFGAPLKAADTNTAANTEEAIITNQESLRSYLQIQEQLHSIQAADDKARQDAELAAARNAELLQMRLDGIEKSMATQRLDELKEIHRSNSRVLIAAGAFLAIGFLVLLAAVFLQWNVVNRLSSVAASLPEHPMLAQGRAAAALGMGDGNLLPGAADQSNLRLLSIVERLEQRLQGLDGGIRPQLSENLANGNDTAEITVESSDLTGAPAVLPAPDAAVPVATAADKEKAETIRALLAKGQTLLKLDKPEEALGCFDEALSIDTDSTDALVKKGAALERLQRLNEAIECYDRAIATDGTMTMAYLYKGGVFNRMERYTEALECYERALKTQDKGLPINVALS